MSEAEVIGAVTDLAGMSLAAGTIWMSITFAYLTAAYFLGNDMSRFQCLAVSALYAFGSIMFVSTGLVYVRATELFVARERSVMNEMPLGDGLPWMWGTFVFFVGGTLLSLYFMYNVRKTATP